MRYLGTLGLLAECSVYVPEDVREMIESAFTDASNAIPSLKWRRILDRLEIEVALEAMAEQSGKGGKPPVLGVGTVSNPPNF